MIEDRAGKSENAYSLNAIWSAADRLGNRPIDPLPAIPFVEYGSVSAFARMTRFGKGPGMRNMANFGSLDEVRHTQIQMYFGYEFVNQHRAFDWAQKAPNTDNWIIISERHTFDDVEHTRDAVSAAIMTNFSFEPRSNDQQASHRVIRLVPKTHS